MGFEQPNVKNSFYFNFTSLHVSACLLAISFTSSIYHILQYNGLIKWLKLIKKNIFIKLFFSHSLDGKGDLPNRLTPNDPYMGRTAPLASKRCILYVYSTNICTEYFKHALYSPFFSSKCSLFHNANLFGSCIIHILYTGCAKI